MKLYRKVKDRWHDFWWIELAGKKVTTQSGGAKPKKSSKTYGTPAKAKAAHDELVAKQRADGWVEMGEVPAPTVPIARDATLEAELRRDRADPAPYLVYADWLQGQGSPLGEMLVLAQRKKSKPTQAPAMAKKIGMPDPGMAKVEWRHGLWRKLGINNEVDHMTSDWDPVAYARALFSSPLCVALEELSIGMMRWDYQDDPGVIAEAGKHAWAADLPRLRVGDVASNIDMNHHAIGTVGKHITKSFPKLTSLWIRSGESYEGPQTFGLDGLALPELEELTVVTCAMSRKRMKSLTAAKLPKLERLELWFGARDREATATIADVAPVWTGAFPRVTHLGLRNTELVMDIVRLLPGSPLAPKLVSLDLSRGTFGDDTADELATNAKSFGALETLDVSRSYLTTAGVRRLKAAFKGVDVIAKDQNPEYDVEDYGTARFVSVHE